MSAIVRCPACQNEFGGGCQEFPTTRDGRGFDCTICGRFIVAGSLSPRLSPDGTRLSPVQRAALAHVLRRQADQGAEPPILTTYWFDDFVSTTRLPRPAEQAANFVRYVGDEVSRTGESLEALPPKTYAIMGSPSPAQAKKLIQELVNGGVVTGIPRSDVNVGSGANFIHVDLTLQGWERYEAERRGEFAGTYGFLALKFGEPDATHEAFFRAHMKPGVRTALGFDIVDMRDAARAGVIDNLMREKIRDSAFVLADLTHDNFGAYWEAGYAEGLGKPVLYICEKSKFKKAQTHFDTNHLTTVLWETADPDTFVAQLVATLRRSLNLFPTS